MAKQAAANRAESAATLHPVLKAALGCMDVQIEDELARYRRQRDARAPEPNVPPATTVAIASPPPAAAATASDANDIADLTRPPAVRSAAASDVTAAPSPEDDLESSKQLRRQLPDPERTSAESEPPPALTWRDRLLTPMGVGSLLVLAVAFALLGSALLAPETLSNLAENWRHTDAEPAPAEPATPAEDETGSIDLQGPNLADDEFDPLDLDALSTVETEIGAPDTRPAPSPADSDAPQIRAEGVELPSRESDLTTALLSPGSEVEPAAEPSPQASPSPSPSPENDAAAANAVPGPAEGDRFYYVVASYGGEQSLRQARGAVPEAYLRRFPQGVQIQMGAFGSEADAQSLIDRLQQQGIAASVYRR